MTPRQVEFSSRVVVAGAWAIHIGAWIPIQLTFGSVFEVTANFLGTVGAVVLVSSLFGWPQFRALAWFAVLLTLVHYGVYWLSIASTVVSHKPDYGVIDLIGRQTDNVSRLVKWQLDGGHYWTAARFLYFEAIAPFLQLAVGTWLLLTKGRQSSRPLQSNSTLHRTRA